MTHPVTVLFVDDEPNVLQAIKRVVRQQRLSWDITFASSGPEALQHLEIQRFDVVVCDLRMPGLDGAEVMAQIKLRSPATTRIILSGYAEEEAVFRAARVAHRFLHKPCDVEDIRSVIDDAQRCHQRIEDSHIIEVLGRVDQLPTLGDVYFDLMEAVSTDDWSPAELGEIVSRDVGLTVELLRLVNSGFFGLTRAVHSVDQAVTFLGLDVVRGVVAGYSLFSDANNAPNIDIDEVAARSRSASILTRASVLRDGGSRLEAAEGYLAGIVHEVGALALSAVSDVDRPTLQVALATHEVTAERMTLGVDRYSVGSYLLGLWGFGRSICDGVGDLANAMPILSDPIAKGLWLSRRAAEIGFLIDESSAEDEETLLDLLDKLDADLSSTAAGSEPSGTST
jgi:HD-like signal output (HDOD) protein